jgi:serine/threonine-protein kinase ATR
VPHTNRFPQIRRRSRVSGFVCCHIAHPNLIVFKGFLDEIDIMRSLAKPRKITIMGSNGQIYTFLGKPKDDLRKDARLMDFNAIINKLLKANSESRRRQLRKF